VRRNALVAVLAVVALLGGALAWSVRRAAAPPGASEALEPLVASPRPPVAGEAAEPFLRSDPGPAEAPRPEAGSRAALLEERNARARDHRDAVTRFEMGAVSIREVEVAEMRLLDARVRLQEIDVATWRRSRIVLLERDLERARRAHDAGSVAAAAVETAALAVERERLLAGDLNEYAARRRTFFEATKEWHVKLVAAGVAAEKTLAEDYRRLEAEYPAAEDLRDAGAR
jgi:hypothetical protein